MDSLKEKLNPEEAQHDIAGPTKYETGRNRYRLHCTICGELYYVDEQTLQKATRTIEGDPSEINFYCDNCEQDYAEEEHAH